MKQILGLADFTQLALPRIIVFKIRTPEESEKFIHLTYIRVLVR